jgi:hypothetical protein
VTLRRTYTEADLAAAAQALGGAPDESLLVHAEGLGVDPEILLRVAVGTAGLQLDQESGFGGALTQGTISFMIGFLIGLWLEARADGTVSIPAADLLPTAARMVSQRGRHAVIAESCDLNAVALAERECGRTLAAQAGSVADRHRKLLEDALVRLFESGLATGLALPRGTRAA